MIRPVLAALAIAIALTGTACSKHDDSTSATDAPSAAADSLATAAATDPSASASPDAQASPGAAASIDPAASPTSSSSPGQAVTYSGNGGSVTLNSDIAKLGVPVYPNAKVGDNQMMEATNNGTHDVVAALSTPDDFATVDAWYKANLPATYKPFHMQVGDSEMTTYTQGSEQALPYDAIVVTRKKGDLETKPSTSIVVTIKETAK